MDFQRRLAAIMFTDIVGYSALSHQDETHALELLHEHQRLLRGLFPSYGGIEIKNLGDGFFIAFASAVRATKCALAIQKALEERNVTSSEERQIKLRIGIHIGDVLREEDDIYGDGVNIASRIEPLAEAGGICVTHAVYEQVNGKIEAELISMGEHNLKNIDDSIPVYKVFLPWRRVVKHGTQTYAMETESSSDTLFKTIAVLPFVSISSDDENEHFSDGLTEEIIKELSKSSELSVISRTSTMRFKNTVEPIRTIAQDLDAQYILEGSVRKAGINLRIGAQLVDAVHDTLLWAESYMGSSEVIFEIQEQVAQEIVEELELFLGE